MITTIAWDEELARGIERISWLCYKYVNVAQCSVAALRRMSASVLDQFLFANMKLLAIFSLIALGAAAPQKRQIASTCELDPTFYKGLQTPNYYIANWASTETGGEQCIVIDSYNADSISWHSTFSWDASPYIRGNPNAGYNHFEKKEISSISSIPVYWEWE